MGRRKATDEAALRELQDALRVVVDAQRRRADPDADPSARRRAMRDLRHGIELVRTWQRPPGGERPMTPSSLGGGRPS